MTCSHCEIDIRDGDHFCHTCGASLQDPGGIGQNPRPRRVPSQPATPSPALAPRRAAAAAGWPKSPYRNHIAQLRLQLKELRMRLRELNNQIVGTRSNYFEFNSFVQRGPVHAVGRVIEGAQLLGPYQERKQLQEQILRIEHELLPLERAQEQWRLQQQQ